MNNPRRIRFFRNRNPKFSGPGGLCQITVSFKKLSLLLIFFIIISSVLIFWAGFFEIHKIDLEYKTEQNCVPKDTVLDNSEVIGKIIFFVDLKNFEKTLLNKFICLEKVEFEKRMPDKLNLLIYERSPMVALQYIEFDKNSLIYNDSISGSSISAEVFFEKVYSLSKVGSVYYIVDHDGYVFKKADNSQNLPILKINSGNPPTLGEIISADRIQFAVNLISKLSEKKIEVSGLRVSEKSIIYIYIKDGPEVLFSAKKDLDFQLSSLQLILSQAKIEGENFKKIDLQFDKPIITKG